jgi:hypothetical protein
MSESIVRSDEATGFGADEFIPEERLLADAPAKGRSCMSECGIHKCKRFGQRPRVGLWLHNLLFHFGK